METRKRHRRKFVSTFENHVTMKVTHISSRRGVFVGDKGCECTWVIEQFSGVNRICPGIYYNLIQLIYIYRAVQDAVQNTRQETPKESESLLNSIRIQFLWCVKIVQTLVEVIFREFSGRVCRRGKRPEEHRMIRHRVKIQRLP